MYIMQTKFVLKMSNQKTLNLKSGLNCPVYILGPVDIMVKDKTDSLGADMIKIIAYVHTFSILSN